MKFKSEQDLYAQVIKELPFSDSLETNIENRNGVNLHLVGESHGSRDPIDYVHREIAPKIAKDPKKWMMVREGLNSFKGYSDEDLLYSVPFQFYFMKLPEVTGIKGEDVVKSPLDSEVKAYVLRNSSLSEKDIDSWYLVMWIHTNKNTPPAERKEAEINLIAKLGKDARYVQEVFEHASKPDGALVSRRVHEMFLPTWNNYSRNKLDRIVLDNPEITNVLVSVGIAHLPAFSNKYTYIG